MSIAHVNSWYVFEPDPSGHGQRLGPLSVEELPAALQALQTPHQAFVYAQGWPDWRMLKDSLNDLPVPFVLDGAAQRNERALRGSLRGRVVIHNGGHLLIGSGVNISGSGIFVEAQQPLFKVGERLRITVRVDGLVRPFRADVELVRINRDPRYPVGFGLKFLKIDQVVLQEIARHVAAYPLPPLEVKLAVPTKPLKKGVQHGHG